MAEEKSNGMFAGLGKKIMSVFDKGVAASKKGLQSAGTAVSDFGEKSVLRIEKTQLQSKADKAYAELGRLVFEKLTSSRAASVSASDEGVKDIVSVIKALNSDIEQHSDAINEGKSEKTTKTTSAKSTAAKTTKAPAKTASTRSTAKTAPKSTAKAPAKSTASKSSAKTTTKSSAKKPAAKTTASKTSATKTTTTKKSGTKKSTEKK